MKYTYLLFVVLLAVGCGGGESSTPAPEADAASEPAMSEAPPAEPATADLDEALVAEGKQLFESTAICFSCHGQDAMGTQLAPNLTDDEWLNIEPPPDMDKLTALIRSGVMEPKQFPAPMPPMANLTDEQVTAVATYVLSL